MLADRRRRAIGLVLFLAAWGLPMLRQRGNPSWDSLWGEDGFLLYQEAHDDGALRTLFRGYTGYLVLLPRLLAVPLAWVEPEHVAAYCAVVGTLVVAVLAALTYRWTDGWIASEPVRLAVAALVVLMPSAAFETTANLVNTIWALVCVAPWAVLARQRGRADVAARAAVVFLAVASSPATFVFLPPALLWAWRRRARRDVVIVVAAFALGAALQGVAMLAAEAELVPVEPVRPAGEVADLMLVRLAAFALVGPDDAVRLWEEHGRAWGLVATGVVAALLLALGRGADRRARRLGGAFVASAVVVLFGLVWTRGTLPFSFGGDLDMRSHTRYSVPAVFLLASGAAVLAGSPGRDARDRRVATLAFVAHTAIVIAIAFPTVGHRGKGPGWRTHLREAAAECSAADQEVLVAQDAGPFWGVRVRCEELPDRDG